MSQNGCFGWILKNTNFVGQVQEFLTFAKLCISIASSKRYIYPYLIWFIFYLYLFGGPPQLELDRSYLPCVKIFFLNPQQLFGIHRTTAIHPKFFSNLSQSILTPDQSFRAYLYIIPNLRAHSARNSPQVHKVFRWALWSEDLTIGDFKCLCTLW